MEMEHLQNLDVNRHHEPTPSPLPGGESATRADDEAPLLGGAGGGFMEGTSRTLRARGDSEPTPTPPRRGALSGPLLGGVGVGRFMEGTNGLGRSYTL